MAVPEKFLNPYAPQEVEGRIYTLWEESGYFNPDNLPPTKNGKRTEPFTVIMPPPNANGSLHAGHALFVSLEDAFIRFARMQGKKTLWLPGSDHAGFETQVVYEKKLEKEGRSRFSMNREKFYQEVLAFTLHNKQFMEGQLRELGASCDWSRKKFTLDADVVRTVYRTFKKLSEDGLLYRGARTVNWCPKHQTSLSNLETVYEDRTEPYWYFQYGPFVISTSRPETKFGDKYVVMHPQDKRYEAYTHGQHIALEWINGPVTATVIKDETVDMEAGTGVMTITPWHDKTDFEIAERHALEAEQIIDERGRLMEIAGEFAGQPILEARPHIVEKLAQKGLLVKTDEGYTHSVQLCYKCKRLIEPQVREQWFIKMERLARRAREAIEKDEVRILTESHKTIALNWLANMHDWNISRQIAWGIPIPAWQKDGEWQISETCPGQGWLQDSDTFDTWFSSGQWPFITLGWPESPDFKTYYPTTVMETGYDILMFWVLRMIILGLYVTDQVPFKEVYLHGLVRDAERQKMSKSKGNVISPLAMTEKYGTDALRMALLVGNTPGTDLSLSEDKIKAYKHFANKLWNITRFVLAEFEKHKANTEAAATDAALLEEMNALVQEVTEDMEHYRLYLAAEKLYHFSWHRFADEMLEESKPILAEGGTRAETRVATLYSLLTTLLRLLHPFMPFITEEIWQSLPKKSVAILMVAPWPESEPVKK